MSDTESSDTRFTQYTQYTSSYWSDSTSDSEDEREKDGVPLHNVFDKYNSMFKYLTRNYSFESEFIDKVNENLNEFMEKLELVITKYYCATVHGDFVAFSNNFQTFKNTFSLMDVDRFEKSYRIIMQRIVEYYKEYMRDYHYDKSLDEFKDYRCLADSVDYYILSSDDDVVIQVSKLLIGVCKRHVDFYVENGFVMGGAWRVDAVPLLSDFIDRVFLFFTYFELNMDELVQINQQFVLMRGKQYSEEIDKIIENINKVKI